MGFKQLIASALTSAAGTLLKKVAGPYLPATPYEWRCVKTSYSQLAEDICVCRLLEEASITHGYYVDVGAFDPVVYSNTALLEKRGWKGINIDPVHEHISKFNAFRPNDINLNCAVGLESGKRMFLKYPSAATCRLAASDDDREDNLMGEAPSGEILVNVRPLSSILEEFAPGSIPFGFLNIDCEGFDLEVLRSNNWVKFKPHVVAIEDFETHQSSEIDIFLQLLGYEQKYRLDITKIFALTA